MAAGDGAPTIVWGPLLTATLMNYIESGELHDQVFTSTAFLNWINSGKRIKRLSGGERISLSIMYEGSGNFKRYTGGEPLDTTRGAGRTRAFFNWKQAATTAGITGLDQRSNMGESQIRDMAKDAVMQAQLTLGDSLATDAFSDGLADTSKQMAGLLAIIATDPTTGTFATINSANNTTWRNQIITGVGAGAVNLLPNLRQLFNDCTEGSASANGAPDACFMPQAVHEIAEAVITPAIRYSPGGQGEMSIEPIFRGAKFFWDEHCQSGVLYVLNSNHIFMFVHNAADMSMPSEGFQRPVNQDELTAQILWQGNMGTNNRRKLGKMTGIT